MPQRFGLREASILLHRWTGLFLATFLIVVGLTGSILAFQWRIDRLLNPELHVLSPPNRPPLDLATIAERAEAFDPHLRVAYFWVDEDQAQAVVGPRTDPFTGRPYDIGYGVLILDPWTGAVLGREGMEEQWKGPQSWRVKVLPFVYSLHTSLTTNTPAGWTIVGVVALIWTLDSFVGFYLTLPRGEGLFWRRWRQAWNIKWNANSTRVHFDLHRAGGLWLWPLLFVFGWSSVMFGLPRVYEPVMKHLFGFVTANESVATNSLPKPREVPELNWRQAQQAGERAMAEQAALRHFTVLRPYGMAYIDAYGAYTYCVRSSIDFRGHGWDTTVLIDGNTGQLRSVDLARGQHVGNSISTLLWGIHFADLRDWLPYRVFVCLFGLFLATLSYTGVVIWWRKRKARKKAKPMRTARATAMIVLALLGTIAQSVSKSSGYLLNSNGARPRNACHDFQPHL